MLNQAPIDVITWSIAVLIKPAVRSGTEVDGNENGTKRFKFSQRWMGYERTGDENENKR